MACVGYYGGLSRHTCVGIPLMITNCCSIQIMTVLVELLIFIIVAVVVVVVQK